jgi:serine/threonine-protein kinase
MQSESELAARVQSRVGTVLRGKYRIDAVLGVGGMAVVYAATHRNQAEFAIKVLHPELSLQQDVRARFLREGYAANRVKHSGAVKVVDDDVAEDGAVFLVMERLHGQSLDDLLEARGGRLGVEEAVAIADRLLDVLTAAHASGVVHRDIKPSNLFVTREGGLKVLDFGIARARDAAAHAGSTTTASGMVLGTPAFMAPEQALGRMAQVDAQTDVWAAGATLFTMLAGRTVHTGDTPQETLVLAATAHAPRIASLAPHVPPGVADVVDRALAYEKRARWASAAAMRDALGETHRGTLQPPAVSSTTTARLEPGALRGAVTTSHPVSSPLSSPPIRAAVTPHEPGRVPARLPVVLAGAGALLVVGLLGVLVVRAAGHRPAAAVGGATGATIQASTAAPPSAPAPVPPAPPEPVVDGTPAPTATAPPSAVAQPARPAAPSTGWSRPAPRPAPTPSARAGAQCNPPFFFDESGNKVFKKECL